ncbi:MAG TPA: protein kinase [Thermoanaerobaculia bacterium]|nr:protein kinase [Thermoanaerobaculia bacterium]
MLSPGSRLGRYEIRSLLGAGGMGEVYLAHDTQLRRPVALKVLGAAARADLDLRRRLEYEARAASALNHPNILTVYDVGQAGDDHFIATEFVDGITLRQRLLRAEPTVSEVLDIAIQIASALAAAEAAGLVHRDVKPDNIMLRADGYVKLLDFGLARSTGMSEPQLDKTDPFVVRGTVFYMSPEQLRGYPLDSRSDIWSTGVVLYELISGRLPFDGDSATDVIANILRNEAPPLTTQSGLPLPPRLSNIVAHAMEKDRLRRYQTARELYDDLVHLRGELMRDASAVAGTPQARQATTESIHIASGDALFATNLPSSLTPLVGRDAERDDVVALLGRDDVRIVTLTGPGGTGKTRLSLAVGAALLRTFDDGVFFVSLAPVDDPQFVITEIASALDVHEGGGALADALKRHLKTKSMLLVLDNLEQVLDAAPHIADLLTAAPRVKVLATSRSPLRIRGEREYAVPPLTTPPLDLPLAAEALASYASVALFLERATAVKSDFTLTEENAREIAEICVRLDGLPLAIELAAARVKMLPPRAMLQRVDSHRMKLLSGGARDLPERQQTMHAAIAWGYNLLDDDEKRLFATLCVFRGGFSLEQAERLIGGTLGIEVFEGLSSLADKAFLRRDPASTDDEPRFVMLETIRDYGLEVLAAEGRDLDVRRAHATLMSESAELGPQPIDHDNYRAALEWSLASDTALAMRLGASLWWSWYIHGHYEEGLRWLGAVLALESDDLISRGRALTGAGAMAFLRCDYEGATELLDASIDLARKTGDRRALAQSLQFRGSIARERGEHDHAIDLHELAHSIWDELGDRANSARSLNYIAFASWLKRDFKRTVELAQMALKIFRELGDVDGVVWGLLNLAAVSLYSGDLDGGEQRVEEALSWARSGDFKEGIAWSLNLLGVASRMRDQDDRALLLLQDSLHLHNDLGDRWRTASVLEILAGVRHDARLFGAAAALRASLKVDVPPVEREQYDRDVEEVGVAEWPGTLEEAVALALS